MTRIKIIGLCLIAIFATSAMVASAAQAGEVGECVKLAKVGGKYTGKYLDKNCQTRATSAQEAEGKKNKYEWSPGVKPANGKFTATSKTAILEGAAGNIECKSSVTVGEWLTNTKDTEQATFSGCELKGAVDGECHSAGQANGVIVTNHLNTELKDEGETSLELNGETFEPKTVGAGEVWDQFQSESGITGIQAEYECASVIGIRTMGNLAGVFTSGSLNVMSTKSEISFHSGEGAQGLYSEGNEGAGWFPIGKGVEHLTAKIKNSGKYEIKS